LCKFLDTISYSSAQYAAICQTVIKKLGKLCHNIQKGLNKEDYIYFLMTQKDIRNISAFQIAEQNNFYFAMETLEIGLIVNKLWEGKLTYHSFYDHSSLYNYLIRYVKGNPFDSFEPLDINKNYLFQIVTWYSSCRLRYLTELISAAILLSIYNCYVFYIVQEEQVMNDFESLDWLPRDLVYIYILWTICVNLNLINVYLFYRKINKKLKLRIWSIFDFLMMVAAFCLLIDTQKLFVEINSGAEYSAPYLTRAAIISINDVLVWLKLAGSLLTLKEFGPIMRVIYLISLATAKYLIIYLFFLLCSIAIYTSLFFKAGDDKQNFANYSQSQATLFNAFVNVLDSFAFSKYKIFGGISLVVFVTLASLILISVLTALQVNIFKKHNKSAHVLHRISLISYYKRYKWDKKYSFLLFLPEPLNVVSLLIMILLLIFNKNERKGYLQGNSKNIKKINSTICKIYFSCLHFPIIFIAQILGELIFLPLCYFKGIFFIIQNQCKTKSHVKKLFNILAWVFSGIFYLFRIFLRDKLLVLKNIFTKIKLNSNEKKLRKCIRPNEVQTFLEFIHSRGKDKSNDLQTLFQDFIDYDLKKKALDSFEIREKVNYIDKLNEALSFNNLHRRVNHSSLFLYKNSTNDLYARNDYLKEFRRICKRNLIILEILENFLIDESRETQFVDVDKLVNLLPRTNKIDTSYMKRLIYTNINLLNKAITKLMPKEVKDQQTILLDKSVKSVQILDQFIDNQVRFKRVLHIRNDDNKGADMYKDVTDILDNVSLGIKETIQQEIRAIMFALNENAKVKIL
jgi:hypothetical protein